MDKYTVCEQSRSMVPAVRGDMRMHVSRMVSRGGFSALCSFNPHLCLALYTQRLSQIYDTIGVFLFDVTFVLKTTHYYYALYLPND